MVMHARKLFRLNDGYFDKKSCHHYEDSMSKYSSKSVSSYGNSNDSSHSKHRRNCSPSNGSNSHSRSESPDNNNWSPSRSYANKSSYSRRSKERDRDRDNKYYDRKKVSSRCSRSSRSPVSHDSKQSYKCVNNYTRNANSNSSDNHETEINSKSNSSKKMHVGEWVEHISSSGKRYYYNSRTQVSQWEKPKEWLEWEKKNGSNKTDRHSSHKEFRVKNNLTVTNANKMNDSCSKDGKAVAEILPKMSATASNSNRSHSKREEFNKLNDRSNNDIKKQTESKVNVNNNSVKRELDESPVDSPIESSNISNACKKINPLINQTNNELVRTQSNASNSGSAMPSTLALHPHSSPTTQTTPHSASNLPKMLLSQLSTQGLFPDLSAEEALRALQQALQITKKVKDLSANQQNLQHLTHRQTSSSPRNSVIVNNESPLSTSSHRHHHSSHHYSHHHHSSHYQHQHHHHQSADGIRQELDQLISRSHINKSPISEKSVMSSTRHESPPSNVNLSSAMSSSSLKPSVPTLTPSLANYFREDLITHVSSWQADHAERQANRYSEESHNIGSHQCTRVSAELKMARSLVRLTEIQSTLQEQRILFATQQIKNVEEWKGQNAPHSSFYS